MTTYHIDESIFAHHESDNDFMTDLARSTLQDNLVMDIAHILNPHVKREINPFQEILAKYKR